MKTKSIKPAAPFAAIRRRTPSQRRAQFTVNAIVEAAQQLLEESGPQALNTRRIAERAGVSIGSLYQYFPNRESIVTCLFEPILVAAAEHGAQRYSQVLSVEAFFIEAYRGQINLVNELSAIDSETFLVQQNYLMWGWYTEKMGISPALRRKNMEKFLRENCETLGSDQIELASFMLAISVPQMIDGMAAQSPDLLQKESLMDKLAGMVQSILNSPAMRRDSTLKMIHNF